MGSSEPSLCAIGFKVRAVRWFRQGGPGIAVRRYEQGQAIYMEQDPALSVFCVDDGNVKIVVDTADGRECPLGLRIPGELLGESCVCGHTQRRESAIALEPVTVRLASTRTFLDFVHRENIGHLLLGHLADGLVTQQRHITILLLEPSERRLAHTLLELSQRHGNGSQLPLRLSQQQLGDMIGTTRSRVGQFLKNFRALGLVLAHDHQGVHVNCERLQEFCR